ncbi:MAG: archaellin/type IV pilin N-terminal domain-containing protein [Candidatus Nezhaarchaeales archaeon]
MLRKPLRCDEKAISPVIATIIIVAVAIVMSIAVAYWMMGLVTTFTRYEKLEYTAAYVVPTENGWDVTLTLKNTGTALATVNNILINGIPYDQVVSDGKVNVDPELPITINVGNSTTITLTLPKDRNYKFGLLTSGISVEITVVTAAGNQYPKTVVLP